MLSFFWGVSICHHMAPLWNDECATAEAANLKVLFLPYCVQSYNPHPYNSAWNRRGPHWLVVENRVRISQQKWLMTACTPQHTITMASKRTLHTLTQSVKTHIFFICELKKMHPGTKSVAYRNVTLSPSDHYPHVEWPWASCITIKLQVSQR